jgi:ABC-type antimicrobial peptide transport system permease subunit
LNVSPKWIETMKIPVLEGRDLRETDTSPGAALINETFARQYFNGVRPVGKWFAKGDDRYEVVGIVRDVPYRSIREPILPAAYVPLRSIGANNSVQSLDTASFIVRTASSNPLALASTLRREITRIRPDFRVSNIRTQEELLQAQTVRERLLSMIGIFFALVALLLAGLGLYGVLDYSVLQRRREIGIRMAIGAQPQHVAGRVTAEAFSMVMAGAVAGLAFGMATARYIESLLYETKANDVVMLVIPMLTILSAALLAAVPAVMRAVRVDPVDALRAE